MENVIAQEKLQAANETIRALREENAKLKAMYTEVATRLNAEVAVTPVYTDGVTVTDTNAPVVDAPVTEPMVLPAGRRRASTINNTAVGEVVAPVLPATVEVDPTKVLYPETVSNPTE
jgi:hypothetical protein